MTRPVVPAVLVAALALAATPAHAAWKYQRVVTAPKVTHVTDVALSADGRTVVSVGVLTLSDPAIGFTDDEPQVVAYDTVTRRSQLVTAGRDGKPANAWSDDITVTDDGRYVLFVSAATNLVAGDTNGATDVFVRDLRARRTTRVNLGYGGTQLPKGSFAGALSGDGRAVVYNACGKVAATGPSTESDCGLYHRDLRTGRAVAVTRTRDGKMVNGYEPRLSRTGRYVVFVAPGQQGLTPDSPATYRNIAYVFDAAKGTVFRVPAAPSPVPGAFDDQSYAAIDPTGRYAATRQTTYPNSVQSVPNARWVLADLTTGATTVLGNATATICCLAPPAFSGDGTVVVYGLVEADADGRKADVVYRRVVKTGATERVPGTATAPCASDIGCAQPSTRQVAVNRTGSKLAFVSSVKLVPDDPDGWADTYLVTR